MLGLEPIYILWFNIIFVASLTPIGFIFGYYVRRSKDKTPSPSSEAKE